MSRVAGCSTSASGPKRTVVERSKPNKEHWFRHSQHQHTMVCSMGASLYEPINVYKPVAPNVGIVDGHSNI